MIKYVEETIKKYPENIAYEFMGKKVTYAKFNEQVNKAARAFKKLGVKEGEIICIAMPNMPQAIIAIYAANKIGAVVNMIHPLSSENEIKMFVNRVKAKTVLVLDQFYNNVKNNDLENIIVASADDELPLVKKVAYRISQAGKRQKYALSWKSFYDLGKEEIALDHEYNEDDVALILHSGGTTGKVKGVCLTNRNINESAKQMMAANPMIVSTDRFLSVMPIFHGNGLVIGIHAMLMLGARCVLIPRFTPESYAKDLLKHKCNYMSGVPALFERLLDVDVMKNADLSFLKGVFSGADFLSVELERRINQFLKEHNSPVVIRQGYGMTEGVVATTLNPVENQKEGSIGKALPGVEIKIVKPGTEEEAETLEVGEIVFSSVTNMKEYYEEPEETKNTMRVHKDNKTWIHSGDLGYVDEDGYYFFKGRIKRMIVTNGYNIFPNELENIIEAFEMVDRCCILSAGISKIKAYIVLNKGYEKNEETKKDIISLCRKSIARYAIPKEIEFIDEMPKTKVGKVDFKALEER